MRIAVLSDRALANASGAACPRLTGFCRELGKTHDIVLFTRVSGKIPNGVKEIVTLPPLPATPEKRLQHSLRQIPHVITKFRFPDYDREFGERIQAIIKDFEVIIVYDLNYAQYLPRKREAPVVVDLVDAPSRVARTFAGLASSTRERVAYQLESYQLKRWERALRDYPIVVIGDCDAKALRHVGASISVIPNGVQVSDEALEVRKKPRSKERFRIGFLGVMDYPPNVDAMKWFVGSVLGELRKDLPNAELIIIGQNPTEEILSLERSFPKVTITGFVEDPGVELANCDVFVCPLRFGTGIKNKVLVALSLSIPVIATRLSLEGIGLVDGKEVLIADTEIEFIEQLKSLYRNRKLAEQVGEAGAEFVRAGFNWETVSRSLESLFKPLAS